MLFNAEYYTSSPREIDQAIDWLATMRNDIDCKIGELKAVKARYERQRRYMRNLNRLADEFKDSNFDNMPYETALKIIMQRFDVEPHRARQIYDASISRAKRLKKKERDHKIIDRHTSGHKKSRIAIDLGVSRQTVYNVIAEYEQKAIF